MNFRTTGVLFGLVLVGGLALLFVTLFQGEETSSEALLEELVSKGVKADQVDTVEMERQPGGKLKMVRSGSGKEGRWEITEPVHARADRNAVERVIDELLRVKP